MKFITDINKNEPDLLLNNVFNPLIIMSLEGQFLARFEAPKKVGWCHESLETLVDDFPSEWLECGANAYINDVFVGSTEI